MKLHDSYVDLQGLSRLLCRRFDTCLGLVRSNAIRGRLVAGRWFVKRSEVARFRRENRRVA